MTRITITLIPHHQLCVLRRQDESYEIFHRVYEVKNNSAQFSISETMIYEVSCLRSQPDSIQRFQGDSLVKIQHCFASRIVLPPPIT